MVPGPLACRYAAGDCHHASRPQSRCRSCGCSIMISQTDIAVALERAWREAMPGNESATRNAMLRALYELLKPRLAVGRFIVLHGDAARCKSSTMASPASAVSTSMGSIAATLKTIWLIGNGNRGTRSGPDDDRALFAGSTPPQVGIDKAYDVRKFVDDLRVLNVTPHVAQNTSNRTSAPTNLATMNSLSLSPTAVYHAP